MSIWLSNLSIREKHIELRKVLNLAVAVTPSPETNPEIVTIFTRREGKFVVNDVTDGSVTLRGQGAFQITFLLSQIELDRD